METTGGKREDFVVIVDGNGGELAGSQRPCDGYSRRGSDAEGHFDPVCRDYRVTATASDGPVWAMRAFQAEIIPALVAGYIPPLGPRHFVTENPKSERTCSISRISRAGPVKGSTADPIRRARDLGDSGWSGVMLSNWN
jgi:hypothetical protein